MSVVLRGFVTPWAQWIRRWADHRMQPAKSPLWLAETRRDGVLIGPYVDPRGQLRNEVVVYKSMAAARQELYLRPTDFAPWGPWLQGSLGLASEETRKIFTDRITGALAHLRNPQGDSRAYIREIISIGVDLIKAIGDSRTVPPELPPEFQAKLDERDRFVEREARERIGAGKDPGVH